MNLIYTVLNYAGQFCFASPHRGAADTYASNVPGLLTVHAYDLQAGRYVDGDPGLLPGRYVCSNQIMSPAERLDATLDAIDCAREHEAGERQAGRR